MRGLFALFFSASVPSDHTTLIDLVECVLMDCTIALHCTGVWASTFVCLRVRGAFLRIRIRATFALGTRVPSPPSNPGYMYL